MTKTICGKNNGYTMVELAMVMIIVGVVMASFATGYMLYMRQRSLDLTTSSISAVTTKLGEFRAAYGRYPCPARINALRTDTGLVPEGYGRETDCASTAIAVGSCVNGICVQQSNRTVGTPAYTPRVRVGAIPFRELNLPEEKTLDGYGNRLVYVVTENLARTDKFSMAEGGIGILDNGAVPASIINPPDSAHFLVLSLGKDGGGAVNKDGNAVAPCPAGGVESFNCHNGNVIANIASYRKIPTSSAAGNNHFDDTISYFAKGDVTPWKLADDDSGNAVLRSTTAKANILNNTNNPDQLSIAGNGIARTRTDLDVANLCQSDGTNCTYASVIGATPNGDPNDFIGLECPPGQPYMVGVVGNKAVCRSEVFTVSCGPNTVLKSIDNGIANCASATGTACPAKTVSVCAANDTQLPQTPDGDTVQVNAGTTAKQNYTCSGGSWDPPTARTGNCGACVESKWCAPVEGCGPGFGGTQQNCFIHTCPDDVDVRDDPLTTANWKCTCTVDMTQNYTTDCPNGQIGYIEHIGTMKCVNGTPTWPDMQNIEHCSPNPNACTPNTVVSYTSCPNDPAHSIKQTSVLSCPSNTWTTTTDNAACEAACTPGQYIDSTVDCPTGYGPGPIVQRSYLDCATKKFGSPTTISGACNPTGNVTCRWTPSGTGTPRTTQPAFSKALSTCTTCGSTAKCYGGTAGDYWVYDCNCK